MFNKAQKSKFFRVATAGATTDGRVIEAADLQQMARTYDPKKYGARLNLEHLRGVLPDGPFKAIGEYEVEVALHHDVVVNITVTVVGAAA